MDHVTSYRRWAVVKINLIKGLSVVIYQGRLARIYKKKKKLKIRTVCNDILCTTKSPQIDLEFYCFIYKIIYKSVLVEELFCPLKLRRHTNALGLSVNSTVNWTVWGLDTFNFDYHF